jgi:hypothetical protein
MDATGETFGLVEHCIQSKDLVPGSNETAILRSRRFGTLFYAIDCVGDCKPEQLRERIPLGHDVRRSRIANEPPTGNDLASSQLAGVSVLDFPSSGEVPRSSSMPGVK